MIKLTDKINTLATALAGSATIASWITTNFSGSTLKVYVGDDATNPVGENEAPFIVLAPAMQPYDLGAETEQRRPAFDVDFGIRKTTSTTASGVTTFDGLALVDALAHLILAQAQTTFGSERVAVAAYTITPIHPLYEAGFTITLWYEAGMGEPS